MKYKMSEILFKHARESVSKNVKSKVVARINYIHREKQRQNNLIE